MPRPVYALAGFLGGLPMPARVVLAIPLVILGAVSLIFYVGIIAAALRMG